MSAPGPTTSMPEEDSRSACRNPAFEPEVPLAAPERSLVALQFTVDWGSWKLFELSGSRLRPKLRCLWRKWDTRFVSSVRGKASTFWHVPFRDSVNRHHPRTVLQLGSTGVSSKLFELLSRTANGIAGAGEGGRDIRIRNRTSLKSTRALEAPGVCLSATADLAGLGRGAAEFQQLQSRPRTRFHHKSIAV